MPTSPANILRTRLASGEISIDQYRLLLAEIHLTANEEPPGAPASDNGTSDTGRILLSTGNTTLYEHVIVHEHVTYQTADITSVGGWHRSNTLNFVPLDRQSFLYVHFTKDRSFHLSEDRAWFGAKRHAELGRLLTLLTSMTFRTRLTNLVVKLRTEKSVILFESNTNKHAQVRLYEDGTLGTSSRRIDIKLAKASGTLGFGGEWVSINGLSSKSDPREVIISESKGLLGGLIPRNALRFVPNQQNTDIVHALIGWLSKPNNHLSKSVE